MLTVWPLVRAASVKGTDMRAKITALSQYSGEQVHIVEVEGHAFYATVVGTVKGITLAGAVVTALEIEEV